MDMKQIAEVKAKLEDLMDEVYATVEKEFEATPPLEGVQPQEEGKSFFTVSFSAIQSRPGHVLSAGYYDAKAQKDAVVAALIGDRPSIPRLVARLERICREKKVETRTHGAIPLNPNTLLVAECLKTTLKGD